MGKTKLIRRLAAWLQVKRLKGFYTEEMRERGQRRGFRLVSFQGQERVIGRAARLPDGAGLARLTLGAPYR